MIRVTWINSWHFFSFAKFKPIIQIEFKGVETGFISGSPEGEIETENKLLCIWREGRNQIKSFLMGGIREEVLCLCVSGGTSLSWSRPAVQLLISPLAHQSLVHDHRSSNVAACYLESRACLSAGMYTYKRK